MKFRLPRRLKYLRKARHWHGHGIHSPFLFYLVTQVIEDKRQYPAYRIFRLVKKRILNQLKDKENLTPLLYNGAFFQNLKGKKGFFKKVELSYRYGKLLLRLIHEFKPSSVFFYGPTFGMNWLYLALANPEVPVFGINQDSQSDGNFSEMLSGLPVKNIHLIAENQVPPRNQEFVFINYPFLSEETRRIFESKMKMIGPDDVMIIRGIHQSQAMETLWKEIVKDRKISVSLDLYEIGILLFRKKLQKQHFILRF